MNDITPRYIDMSFLPYPKKGNLGTHAYRKDALAFERELLDNLYYERIVKLTNVRPIDTPVKAGADMTRAAHLIV